PAAAPRTMSATSPSPDAPAARAPDPLAPACSNGIDDDGDGLIDFRASDGSRQDRGCNGWNDNDE
ncbi:MAG TPA: hypothetical protein VM754_08650, partial [Actinomycetota bacterium]|nr:hypothetical protein [Actinomycetota bacterium]